MTVADESSEHRRQGPGMHDRGRGTFVTLQCGFDQRRPGGETTKGGVRTTAARTIPLSCPHDVAHKFDDKQGVATSDHIIQACLQCRVRELAQANAEG